MITLVKEQSTVEIRTATSVSVTSKSLFEPPCFFSPGDSLFNRRVTAHKGVGNLVHAESAKNIQNECDLRLYWQSRMAAGKHQSKLVVFDRALIEQFIESRREHPFTLKHPADFGLASPSRAIVSLLIFPRALYCCWSELPPSTGHVVDCAAGARYDSPIATSAAAPAITHR